MDSKHKRLDRKKLIMLISVLVVILLIVVLAVALPSGSDDPVTVTEPPGETKISTENTESSPDESPGDESSGVGDETVDSESSQDTVATTESVTADLTEDATENTAESSGETETEPETQSTEQTDSTPLPEPPTQASQAETSGGQSQDNQPTTAPVETTPATEAPTPQETETPTEPTMGEIASGDITCDDYGSFTGQYMEDGRDELVENVAAILVTNQSDQFLEFAILSIEINGELGTFVATGLPAGTSAWVLEIDRMKIGDTAYFEYQDCISSFRDEAVTETDKLTITASGNMLTVKNNTNETLSNVYVYYKARHADGNYLGGITYRVDFGTLSAGEAVEMLAGHYDKDVTEIVHISWRTE